MTLSRRSLFKYVGAGTAALTSVPVLAQEKSPRNPYLPEVWDENYDVVVVGGGGAGMAAALLASQNGAKPVIIERLPFAGGNTCLLYTSPSPRDRSLSRMPSSA